ncbi:putative transfer protein [Streptococcus infantarius subsp. infantarius]|uniref:conjugal transfer protein n=1 Tax=uncultured Streptococcus sp. TaxID=83427 RepID=UPI00208E3F8F|nr:conjugal transfer protein [uncultured Streptococcus sp.]MCO4640679.1 putative transfer protein [Streptococcus infantarius subsp. infantarius]MCO4645182.1 putative transfer protein [Streptococcus infantarius subsp. infantarius]MCO4662300.1 putative transfer protein [Streptococcus infantarius subsp. infantarius]MCO4670241.1 putative transfer protein [Streptococcus infantarius subsp. infantarius]MCO4677156.1 putative transfer protein [Streptococcus infantarius subsp. infantarius]
MAKVGLNFGEKLQVADKEYRILNDGLVQSKEILGDLKLIAVVEEDLVYTDDTSQPRRQDGTYPQVPTGETRGLVLSVSSSILKKSVIVTVSGMTKVHFEGLGINYRDTIEFDDLTFAYVSIGKRSDRIKLLASNVKKVAQAPNQPKQQEQDKK